MNGALRRHRLLVRIQLVATKLGRGCDGGDMKRRDVLAGGLAAAYLMRGAHPLLAQEPLSVEITPQVGDQFDAPTDPTAPRRVPIVEGIPAGELHVDPGRFSLYLTEPGQTAIRYFVGIGRPGLYESGTFTIGAKKEWPSWTPTPDMIEREPEAFAQWADGMPGGLNNPLGARAIYLFQPQIGDTFLRIHGTNAPGTIGRRVSNGCARLVNEQIIDLYNRVQLNSRVILYPAREV